ncbi:MAG: class I SAM-dependent methyltransferase [Deltaproteobacteria bacterium]|nr:class I SAM-dependent methyltransferase [Deltaproteobacteria bacterium]
MARLASQMKMGFYATPVKVVKGIKKMLSIRPQARLLDTCCGEGEALKIIAEGTQAETYGAELDRERFGKAKEVLDHVVWGDALHEFMCSRGAFGLLWLNPPYDSDEGAFYQERERLEVKFLNRHWNYLQDGGVLIYIIPFFVLRKIGEFFRNRCKNLFILSFPREEYDAFKQVVIICVKGRPTKEEVERNVAIFETVTKLYSWEAPEKLPTTETADLVYDVPPAPEIDQLIFRSIRLDPAEALQRVQKSPVWNQLENLILPPVGVGKVKPLMPLREGHLAMLLASGMMNGEVVGEDGQKLVVKGSVKKVVDQTHEQTEDADKYIETDRYEITVRAICFDPQLEIITIS